MNTIGIDLGTTNSCVAYNDGEGSQIIETLSGTATMPSVVAIEPEGGFVVGARALRRITRRDPRYIFSDIKRHIGMTFVEGEDYGFQIAPDMDGKRAFVGPDDNTYTPIELSAQILLALKEAAEKRLGGPVHHAVITVPTGFNNNRILDTKEAGRLAGFRKVTIMTEPEAACLAYGLDRAKFTRALVFDLGGGTEDVVLADVGQGLFKVRAKSGDDDLGGGDWDRQLRNEVVTRFADDTGMDLTTKPLSMMKIAPIVEEAKKELSEARVSSVDVQNAAIDTSAGIMRDISYDITREAFETMTAHLVEQAMQVVRDVMTAAARDPDQVDEVLLVGGMSRVPSVRRALAAYFGEAKLRDGVSPDLAVAIGAAIRGAQLDGRLTAPLNLDDVTAHGFGLETTGGRFHNVVRKGAAFGNVREVVVTTANEGQTEIPLAILQGEHPDAVRNAVIGRYVHAVQPGAAGSQAVLLEFMVDENGILMVAGEDLDTGETFEVLGGENA